MNDLQILNILLSNLGGPLPIQAVRLHALRGVFYNALGGQKSLFAQTIHDAGSGGEVPAPYTIGPVFEDGSLMGLRITTLENRTAPANIGSVVADAWKKLEGKTIRVGSANMIVQKAEAARGGKIYEQLWDEVDPGHGLKLRFEMPARFPFNKYNTVLPIPSAVWQFYERRWRTFCGIALPLEFLTWVVNQVHATEATLETRLVPIEAEETVMGIMGDITYQAYREKKSSRGKENMVPESQLPTYLRAWQVLANLAEYCGTGEHANIGMGRTKVIASFGAYQRPQAG